jgi:LPXTG-site transpeptidase (sortase) family protein
MSYNVTKSGAGCLANLLTIAGVLLLIAGGIAAYPALRNAVEPTPASFGEDTPPLRPTVTPLPAPGSQAPQPLDLPETPLLAPGQPAPTPAPAATASPDETAANIPTRIIAASIGLDAPIETVGWSTVNGVSSWNVPNHHAAGWLKTSVPLGQPGNTVLDGHHNIDGEVFRYLVNLKQGDPIEIYSYGQLFSYRVTTRHILQESGQPDAVRRKNAEWIQPTADERLTLVTCWPYTSNTHRLIIVAKPLDARHGDVKP